MVSGSVLDPTPLTPMPPLRPRAHACTGSHWPCRSVRKVPRAFASRPSRLHAPCRIRSDRQTTSLTLTTGMCEAGTKRRGASNMNIHYDVTGLLTAAWRSHSGQIVWAA